MIFLLRDTPAEENALCCPSSWVLEGFGAPYDLPAHGSEGQQRSFMLLSVCDPAEAALDVRTTLQNILAMLGGALQVIPLLGK